MNVFICPLCAEPLACEEPLAQEKQGSSNSSLRCINNHSFDLAKEAYVNLLPVQKKKSKEPGDSAEMIQARRAFLNAGYYQVLADALLDKLSDRLTGDTKVLDLGCGEGYYTRYMQNQLAQQGGFDLYGIDISKTAVRYAAKQNADGNYAVANAYELPFADHSFDSVIQIYAYGHPEEVARVLRPEGVYVIVSPNENHLIELKQRIYDNPKQHEAPSIKEGFEEVATYRLSHTISPDKEARLNLLKMTPFYWATTEEKQTNIENEDVFSISLDFTIQVLRVKNL